MRFKNYVLMFKNRLPLYLFKKSFFQIASIIFLGSIIYYSINLIAAIPEKMETDCTKILNFEENNIQEETEEIRANKININTATKEELMQLPNIGAKKADDIINQREAILFSDIEDLMEVKGIGEKTFAKLKDLIMV